MVADERRTPCAATSPAAAPTNRGLDAATLRARTLAWRRLADTTLNRLRANLEQWPDCWVAWSGGKDSTTVAHLAHQIRPGIPVIHFDSGLDFPENVDYMADLAARFGWAYEPIQVGDGLRALRDVGTWGHDHPDGDPDALHRYWHTVMTGPSDESQRRHGNRMLIGLHHDESATRNRALHRAGGHQRLQHGLRSWAPIGHWTTADVWAYHAAHGIPENPVYTRLRAMGAPEKALRLDLVVGANGLQHGRIAWLRRGWPDLYQRYAAALPRLREFA